MLAVTGQEMPGYRLVTQNLLVSAAVADVGERPSWPAIQDLTTLIDILCLYDRMIVLGREFNSLAHWNSPVLNLIRAEDLLEVAFPRSADEEVIAASAKHHLLTYLGEKDLGNFDGLVKFALAPSEISYGLCFTSDGVEHIEQGDTWLRTAPRNSDLLRQLASENEVARSTTFVVRTFLYAAYSDVAGVTLVPDAARVSLLHDVIATEQGLRAALLARISAASAEILGPAPVQLARFSPLASVVFERAKRRDGIADEVARLREELAPMRKRIRKAEQAWRFGKGNEVINAASDWQLVTDELVRSYGAKPHLVSLDQLLGFGAKIGDLGDSPHDSKSWVAFLLGLPFEVARRILLRRPAIELHRLRRDRPGIGRLARAVERLFGTQIF